MGGVVRVHHLHTVQQGQGRIGPDWSEGTAPLRRVLHNHQKALSQSLQRTLNLLRLSRVIGVEHTAN